MAVGLRPCSGAIIVLIFALAQDLFWTGVGATLLMGLGTAMTVAAIATVAVSAFTPRRPKSPWSKSNVDRVAQLIADDRMMAAG